MTRFNPKDIIYLGKKENNKVCFLFALVFIVILIPYGIVMGLRGLHKVLFKRK